MRTGENGRPMSQRADFYAFTTQYMELPAENRSEKNKIALRVLMTIHQNGRDFWYLHFRLSKWYWKYIVWREIQEILSTEP